MSIRVLLVDDHPVFRSGLAVLLEVAGMEVVGETASGAESVDLAARTEPDVVVMDVGLPDLDGTVATERVLAASPRTHVLMVTMYDDDDALGRSLRAGAHGYVLKDAPAREVVAAVELVASGAVVMGSGLAGRMGRVVAGGLHRATAAEGSDFPELSDRERQVLGLLAKGLPNAAIAERLGLSSKTVANYVSAVLTRLGVPDRGAAAALVAHRAAHGRGRPQPRAE